MIAYLHTKQLLYVETLIKAVCVYKIIKEILLQKAFAYIVSRVPSGANALIDISLARPETRRLYFYKPPGFLCNLESVIQDVMIFITKICQKEEVHYVYQNSNNRRS